MAIVSGSPENHQIKISEICSHLFIDEAHHVKAKSWDLFKQRFTPSKVLLYTATPFRNDLKRLDGKTIFNFPLKKAQEQGYFKKINFHPIREYDLNKADKLISEIAVEKLRKDISDKKNHILMARCQTKDRAEEVFKLYEEHADLKPVVIHSRTENKKQVLQDIIDKKHKIIVAVDMLGEGFDLPELKIAAFHDIRKSLPVTLQFAGRFTRTKYDEELGEASFIANLADLDVINELEELYSQDADWNLLLSSLSADEINEKMDYEEFISGFKKLDDSTISIQNIRTPLSAVVYKNHTKEWNPKNFIKGMPKYEESDYRFHDINRDKKMLIIVTAQKNNVEWGKFKDIFELKWDITIVFWETKENLLFIYDSTKGFNKELAEAIIGKDAELINQINIFRAFHGLKRISLKNVGLKQFIGKNISFRMAVGTDVEKALSIAEKKKGQKAFVSGVGYKNGEKFSIGCSYKGRVWSKLRGGLKEYLEWCKEISKKLADETIDPNQILRDALMPTAVSKRPYGFPVWIDWDEEIYRHNETKYDINIDGVASNLSDYELRIIKPTVDGGLLFAIENEDLSIDFELTLNEKEVEGNIIYDYEIVKHSSNKVFIEIGGNSVSITEFLYRFTPTIWFADGSALNGNYFIELKQEILPYPKDNLISWDWKDVDISKEAQQVNPKITNSIQFEVIQRLKKEDFDIIYDDDYSGEIADVIAVKEHSNKLVISLYHLKYAKEGKVSNQITNFYEVCGQAQKSIHWKYRSGREFFEHLLRREVKRRKGSECSRIEKGSIAEIERLLSMSKRIPIHMEVYIVQPSLSKSNPSDNILTLLGVTENYLKELADIDLKVITNI